MRKKKYFDNLKRFSRMWYHIGISYYTTHPSYEGFECAWNQYLEDLKIDTTLIEQLKKIIKVKI